MDKDPHSKLPRRVGGVSEYNWRLDGLTDLLLRARDASVFDVGCNRGLVSVEMARKGARLVHGCDVYAPGIQAARELFADLRGIESRFELCELRDGPKCFDIFGQQSYDIVLFLAVDHKLRRPPFDKSRPAMTDDELGDLVRCLGKKTEQYLGYREEPSMFPKMDAWLGDVGLKRIATSEISTAIGPTAIWRRV